MTKLVIRLSAVIFILYMGLTFVSCHDSAAPKSTITAPSERLIAAKDRAQIYRELSPDAKRVAYTTMSGGVDGRQSWVVVDGVDGKKYDVVTSRDISRLCFSPDSKSVAYIVTSSGKSFVVVNEKEGKRYDSIGGLSFSPDGKRVAYFALIGVKYFLVVDGSEGKKYDPTGEYAYAWYPIFSPDGQRVAFIASADHKLFVVVDGDEQPAYEKINIPVFSPDSKHIMYTAFAEGKSFLVVDGKEGKQYTGEHSIYSDSPTYSPDSKHLAYIANDGTSSFINVDGTEGKHYDSISNITFSPDSQHLAYCAHLAGKTVIVYDGVEHIQYDSVSTPLFSPDSQRLVYVGSRDGWQFVVINGVESESYEYQLVHEVVFSPDTRRLALSVQPSVNCTSVQPYVGCTAVVVDGVEWGRYDPVRIPGGLSYPRPLPVFSPDSRHVLYRVNQQIVVDGIETQVFGTPFTNIFFDSSEIYYYLADKDGDTYLVERLVPQEDTDAQIIATVPPTKTPAPTRTPPAPTTTPPPTITQILPLDFTTSLVPALSEYQTIYKPMLDEIEQKCSGRIRFTVYHSGSLVIPAEQYDAIATGVADMGVSYFGYISSRFPLSDAFTFPAAYDMTTSSEDLIQATGNRIFALAPSETKVLCYFQGQPYFLYTASKQVKILNDIKGLTIGTTGSLQSSVLAALGAVPVPISSTEIYHAMEKGVIDGVLVTPSMADSLSLTEVTKYVLRLPFGYAVGMININANTWSRIPDDLKPIFEEVAGKAPYNFVQLFNIEDAEVNSILAKQGGAVCTPSAAELNLWVDAVKPVINEWIASLEAKGWPAMDLVNSIRIEAEQRGVPFPF